MTPWADRHTSVSDRTPSGISGSVLSRTFVAAISSAVLGTGVALPATVPALVLSDGWRTVAPIPAAHVPKHVLLSVFLV